MTTWPLQHAKSRLSEVVKRALDEGPQVITRRGAETAVLISYETYQRLTRPQYDLVDFMARSPFREDEIDVERSRDTGRDIEALRFLLDTGC